MVYRDYTIFLKYSAISMYHNYFEIQTEVKQHSLKKLQDIPTQFVKKNIVGRESLRYLPPTQNDEMQTRMENLCHGGLSKTGIQ